MPPRNSLSIRAFMIHFTHYAPNWIEKYKPREKPLDLKTALAIVDAMARTGLNTLVIDCEDGVRFKSHPELRRKYSAPMADLTAIARHAAANGIDIVPKLNFSVSAYHKHNDWFLPYNDPRFWHTEAYYRIAFELIDELIAASRPNRFFHIGMDEDHDRAHSQYIHAIKTFRAGLKKRGLRTVIWNDSSRPKGALVHAEKSMAAEPKIPKDIVQVPWDYQKARPAIVRRLANYGFEVWGAPGRKKEQILSWKRAVLRNGGNGVFLTWWLPCRPAWKKRLIEFLDEKAPLLG
jgi:hypothetical protein